MDTPSTTSPARRSLRQPGSVSNLVSFVLRGGFPGKPDLDLLPNRRWRMRGAPALLLCSFASLAGVCAFSEPVAKTSQTAAAPGWVTIAPEEFPGAINNPLKGFRDYKEHGYGLLVRTYVPWGDIEVGADDTVERVVAYTNQITRINGRRFEDLNVKLVPRVFLDWNGSAGTQHWPSDLHTFDYDSPAFQERVRRLVAKLGEAWDNDPRIFAVQMGIIGYWGEHHTPAPTAAQRRLLTEAFQQAFRHKPVLVRQNNPEFMAAGFGIYYDTFATLSREPPTKAEDQFPWMATHLYPDVWKHAPIEGEVEYNWQNLRPESDPAHTFGLTADATMKVPAYRHYMLGKIRQYHASYLGWISKYDDTDREVLAGAAELQKAFGYRFVLDSISYPQQARAGDSLEVKLAVRNTGSAPFYLDWPVAVALLDPKTEKPVWSAPLSGVDIRGWLPGEEWDEAGFAYRRLAPQYHATGNATLPADLKRGVYILALSILDRQGGMVPSARFAIQNYFRGGWHPLGYFGVGRLPRETVLSHVKFDSPAFDDSLHYRVPAKLRAVKSPPAPRAQAVEPWTADPKGERINPWRYWTLEGNVNGLEREIFADGSGPEAVSRRVIRVTGTFVGVASLRFSLGKGVALEPGRYLLTCRVRGTPGQAVDLEVADSVEFRLAEGEGPSVVARKASIPLTAQWQDVSLDFEIPATFKFKNQVYLQFRLPRAGQGTFDLTDPHLRASDAGPISHG